MDTMPHGKITLRIIFFRLNCGMRYKKDKRIMTNPIIDIILIAYMIVGANPKCKNRYVT